MIKKVRHLGIVVEDVEAAVKKYEGFGLTCSERFEKEEDGMEFAFGPFSRDPLDIGRAQKELSFSIERDLIGSLDHVIATLRQRQVAF